jgi:pimeloyl-ACP methyl ester carboxylesterase
MKTLQEKQLQQDKYSLYYYTQGDPARELIVFIHPAYGDHTCFHHQMDIFAENYHVISLDMLGHGKSQVNGANVTIEKTAELVAEIIEREGHREAHLVGVSLGSLMAQYIADKYPQKVKTVTVTGGYSIFGDNQAITKAQNSEIIKAFFLILFHMDGFRRYVVKSTNVVEAERETFYQAMQHFTRRSLQVMPGMQKIMDKTPKSLPQPLLIVAGEHDLPIVYANSLAWHKQEPNSRLAIIPAAGHCANMDNAPEFNRVLGEFLKSIEITKTTS